MSYDFFDERQGPAVFKHAILKRYVRIYFSKTGHPPPHRGLYLDGYAGPGTYEDESPGSPTVAVDALEPLTEVRDIDLVFVEKNPATFDELQQQCRRDGFENAVALKGLVEEHIDSILTQALQVPMLAFFDPFGMGLPLETLHAVLDRPQAASRRLPTEVLLNVSLPGLYRNAGKLDSQATHEPTRRAHAKTVDRLDAHLGGEWWRPIWRSELEDRIERIVDGYIERLQLPGWETYRVPVSEQWRSGPKYFIVLITQHEDGIWLFNQSVSLAVEDFHRWCHQEGQQSLEQPDLQAPVLSSHIASNVVELLREDGDFVIIDRLTAVLGDTLGYARETHIRKALRQLHGDGVVEDEPRGSLERFFVRSTGKFPMI